MLVSDKVGSEGSLVLVEGSCIFRELFGAKISTGQLNGIRIIGKLKLLLKVRNFFICQIKLLFEPGDCVYVLFTS